jgi:hypothetical protein
VSANVVAIILRFNRAVSPPAVPVLFRGAHLFGILIPDRRGCCRTGEFESGLTAALLGAMPAAALGGIGTILVALLWMKLFPALRDVERLE